MKKEEQEVAELPEVAEEDEGAPAGPDAGADEIAVSAQPQEVDSAVETTQAEEVPDVVADSAVPVEGMNGIEAPAAANEDATVSTEEIEKKIEESTATDAQTEVEIEAAVPPSGHEAVAGTLPESSTDAHGEVLSEIQTDEPTQAPVTESIEATTEPSAAEPEPAATNGETEIIKQEDATTASSDVAVDPKTAAELSLALAKSAENAASAYKSRTRRRSSVSSTDSRDTIHAFQPEVTPSPNRLSILYESSQRRMCFDAEVVEKIRVYREEGRIEVLFKAQPEDSKGEETDDGGTLLPKGFLVSRYGRTYLLVGDCERRVKADDV